MNNVLSETNMDLHNVNIPHRTAQMEKSTIQPVLLNRLFKRVR